MPLEKKNSILPPPMNLLLPQLLLPFRPWKLEYILHAIDQQLVSLMIAAIWRPTNTDHEFVPFQLTEYMSRIEGRDKVGDAGRILGYYLSLIRAIF